MSQPLSYKLANKCTFVTILGCMLPFYAPTFDGDTSLALAAIAEMIEACCAATPAEFDLAGRALGYAAAAMRSLKLSMQPDLNDARILQYQRSAIALGHSADQCRKALEAMRTEREKQRPHAAATSPAPAPRPAPVASPAARPRQMPPAPPHPAPNPASTQAPVPSQPPTEPHTSNQPPPPAPAIQPPLAAQPQAAQPHAAQPAHPPSSCPNSEVDGDPELTIDLEVMKHNTRAMLADLQALAAEFAPEAPEASTAPVTPPPTRPSQPANGASP